MLTNDTLLLRAVEPADADLMWEVENDSTHWMQNGMAAPLSRQNLIDYALSYDADPIRAGQLRLIVDNIESSETVGMADLYDINAINRTAFVGIYILPGFRGKDYGSEALGLLEEYASDILNLQHLGAKVAETNEASIRLFRNSRYEYRGELPNWIASGKRMISMKIFSKLIK